LTGSAVEWTCREIGIEKAAWIPSPEPLDRTLFESDLGHVVWTVIHPRAEATIHLEDGIMRGHGYVDYVDLTISPWALPFDRLLWGRFHTHDHGVTWLRIDGERPSTVVLLDGIEKRYASVDNGRVILEQRGSYLDLEILRTLRSGSIAAAAFPSLIHFALPSTLRQMREHKYLSRGILRLDDGSEQEGLAIHEEVSWK
jgi:hypothetical protein